MYLKVSSQDKIVFFCWSLISCSGMGHMSLTNRQIDPTGKEFLNQTPGGSWGSPAAADGGGDCDGFLAAFSGDWHWTVVWIMLLLVVRSFSYVKMAVLIVTVLFCPLPSPPPPPPRTHIHTPSSGWELHVRNTLLPSRRYPSF